MNKLPAAVVFLLTVLAGVMGYGCDWGMTTAPDVYGSSDTAPTPRQATPPALPAVGQVTADAWAGTITGDGQTPWRLRAALGGAHAITIPESVTLRVSEPHCLPRPSCISVGDPVIMVLTTLQHIETGSLLVLALDLVWPDSGLVDPQYESGELGRIVIPAAGSEAALRVHATFDAIVASLTRVEPPDGLQGYY